MHAPALRSQVCAVGDDLHTVSGLRKRCTTISASQRRTCRGGVIADAVGEVGGAAEDHHADEEPIRGVPETVQRSRRRHVLDRLVDAGDRPSCSGQHTQYYG